MHERRRPPLFSVIAIQIGSIQKQHSSNVKVLTEVGVSRREWAGERGLKTTTYVLPP